MRDLLEKKKVIAILRKVPMDKLEATVQALYDGGIRFVEVTFDQASPTCIQDTQAAIRLICEKFPDIHAGAGTVLTVEQVEAAKAAGAKYIISPDLNLDVVHKTVELDMLSIPGAMTSTEIATAHREGATYVKIFPAGNLGPSYIKALQGPFPHIPLMAVGGVDISNMEEMAKAGIKGFGIGGNIVKKDLINEGKFDELTKLAAEYNELGERI